MTSILMLPWGASNPLSGPQKQPFTGNSVLLKQPCKKKGAPEEPLRESERQRSSDESVDGVIDVVVGDDTGVAG
ncbi:MAG: hypothetical protein VKI83_03270, partial [Synechococcaceae cyanobacterium]|nr:hypothetical protein [Synechococcaceae cyanobacterium]